MSAHPKQKRNHQESSDEEEVYEQGGFVDMGESEDEVDDLEEGMVNIKLKQVHLSILTPFALSKFYVHSLIPTLLNLETAFHLLNSFSFLTTNNI